MGTALGEDIRTHDAMKTVLMVAYHYPPEGSSSGVLRSLKFSRYLPAYGWRPHVLTLRESVYPVRDESLKAQIPPEVMLHRTAGWDSARHFAIGGRHFEWTAIPDSYISWLPFAVRCGLQVIRGGRIDALFSTSPKPTAHLIAATLKRRTGIPWIADFRDPWIEPGVFPRPGSMRCRVEKRLEAVVTSSADRLTVTTPELRDEILRRYPAIPSEKVVVVYNGYDEDDFKNLDDAAASSRRFELIHAGMVTPDYRDPAPLLRAVAHLCEHGDVSRQDVRVVFLGAGHYVASAAFRQIVESLRLNDVVQVAERVAHHDSLRRLYQASVLVVLQAEDTQALIPAKVFEYLRVGRPILALTSEGATARLMREAGVGIIAEPTSFGAILHAVRTLYAAWKAEPDRYVRPAGLSRFTRVSLTGELARLLETVSARTVP
jgi:glycosyltransferase involved in cell wall biosynthesis